MSEQQPSGRPRYEVADVFRLHWDEYCKHHKVSAQQRKTVEAILRCRTAELGAHVLECDECGHVEQAYNSCGNRHCPKCQYRLKEQWVQARLADLLPIAYHHVVFTLPDGTLHYLMLLNKEVIYALFFESAAETLAAFGRDPKFVGGQIGFIGVLHTWSQQLGYHPHLHFIVTAGALAADGKTHSTGSGQAWLAPKYAGKFLFPVRALSKVLRGKFLHKLEKAFDAGQLQFAGKIAYLAERGAFKHLLRQLAHKRFHSYSKPPFDGPETVVRYLGRYTHRVAISNARILDIADGNVRFQYKDNPHDGKRKQMTLPAGEFIRRFLLHILPKGFHKLRHFGFLASGVRKKKLAVIRQLLAVSAEALKALGNAVKQWVHRCPMCEGGQMHIREFIPASQLLAQLWASGRLAFDTS